MIGNFAFMTVVEVSHFLEQYTLICSVPKLKSIHYIVMETSLFQKVSICNFAFHMMIFTFARSKEAD